MAKDKDPAEVIATIAQSIRVSQRGARRVRAHRFKELFGYQALTAQRRERIEQLMTEAGIVVTPVPSTIFCMPRTCPSILRSRRR
jgi:hypothetical protein